LPGKILVAALPASTPPSPSKRRGSPASLRRVLHVFFTETHTNLDKNKIKVNYIGEFADTHYFLLFDGIGKNVLDRSFLKELKAKEGKKIVYADKCLLGEEILEKHQIIFKQIPYQVKVY